MGTINNLPIQTRTVNESASQRFVPGGGSAGQFLGKTANGFAWLTPPTSPGGNGTYGIGINASAYNTLTEVLGAAAAAEAITGRKVLITISKELPQTTTVTVPATNCLNFVPGGFLYADNCIININGEIRADDSYIFVKTGEDAEINVTNATADYFYFEWFGIIEGEDNTEQMQELLSQRKGAIGNIKSTIIRLMDKVYRFKKLYITESYNIKFIGVPGAPHLLKSELRCIATNAEAIQQTIPGSHGVTAQGQPIPYDYVMKPTGILIGFSSGIEAEYVNFSYRNPAFTGYLIRGGRGLNQAGDAQRIKFSHCQFAGFFQEVQSANNQWHIDNNAYKARCLVYIGDAVDWTFDHNVFRFAEIGVMSCDDEIINNATLPNLVYPGQANTVNFIGNLFIGLGQCTRNNTYNWQFIGNTYESPELDISPDGSSRLNKIIDWGDGTIVYRFGELRIHGNMKGRINWNANWYGNWIGDQAASQGEYSFIDFEGMQAAVVSGNTFNANAHQFQYPNGGKLSYFHFSNCTGVSISGNFGAATDELYKIGTTYPSDITWGANKFAYYNDQDKPLGGIFKEIRLGMQGHRNAISGGLTVHGSAGTDIPKPDLRSLTFGTINNQALDSLPAITGSSIRTTAGVPGVTDGSLVLMPNSVDYYAEIILKNGNNYRFSQSGRGTKIGIQGSNISEIRLGSVTMAAGAVTVSDARITANSKVFVQNDGNNFTGKLNVIKTAGTGFTITSKTDTDAGTVNYFIVEPGL